MLEERVFYRKLDYEKLIQDMYMLESGEKKDIASLAGVLIEFARTFGFYGNLWHALLAYSLVYSENPYTKAAEITGKTVGSLDEMVLYDLEIFIKLFSFKLEKLPNQICAFTGEDAESRNFDTKVRDAILLLANDLAHIKDARDFRDRLKIFYQTYGIGMFGLYKAFRIKEGADGFEIIPISHLDTIYLDDLIGYEIQKERLVSNTLCFLEGKVANNVLLYGDAGCGKSSSIKAIVNAYFEKGMRIIEVYKHQFHMLVDLIDQIKDRNYKYIIYMDDLSFEDFELDYKYLKAILEGGLGKRPDNVIVYATSNRRHLIRESFSDKKEIDDELHRRDTLEEKTSLAKRFGISIYFGSPDKKEFNDIVLALAKKYNISMETEDLIRRANIWEMSHGGLSGRSASQFVTYIKGIES